MTYRFLAATAAYGHPSGLWLWEWELVSLLCFWTSLLARRPRTLVIRQDPNNVTGENSDGYIHYSLMTASLMLYALRMDAWEET